MPDFFGDEMREGRVFCRSVPRWTCWLCTVGAYSYLSPLSLRVGVGASDNGESRTMHILSGARASCVFALTAVLAFSDLNGQTIKVTLLGTGGPLPSIERFGPSTLIEAGGQTFLIDAGRGALQRLVQAGVLGGTSMASS